MTIKEGVLAMVKRGLIFLLFGVFLVGFSAIVMAQDTSGRFEDKLFHISQTAAVSASVFDTATTVYNLTHPVSMSYHLCQDGSTTCVNPGLGGTKVFFEETNKTAGMLGKSSPVAVSLVGTAMDIGELYLSRYLYKRGGIWGKIAIGLNFTKAGYGLAGGIHNIRVRRSVIERLVVPAGAFNIRW